jgi:transcriptional regulator with XRE-family HTH domain
LYLEQDVWAELIGLDVRRRRNGNISYAELDGERISNSRAYRILGSVEYVYWSRGRIHIRTRNGREGEQVAEWIRDGIAERVCALPRNPSPDPASTVRPGRAAQPRHKPQRPAGAPEGEGIDAAEIISARRAAGWTRVEIARAVGVSGQTVSNWESGARPGPDNAARLAALPAAPPCRSTPVDAVQAVTNLRTAGWSFTRIAREAGVTATTVTRWGTATAEPQSDHAARLSELAAALLPSLPPPPPADETIKTLRASGWSMRWIGEAIDVAQVMVDRWGRGTSRPGPAVAARLAALVGTSPPVPADFDAAAAVADLRAAGWTLHQIGHQVGAAGATVSEWQRRRSQPMPATVVRLAALIHPLADPPGRATPEPAPVPPDFDAPETIKTLRASGWSMRWIGEAIDVAENTVYLWQRGVSRPRPAVAARLAALVGTSPPVPADFDAAAAVADLRAAGWTLHQIGHQVGVTSMAVHQWQKGRRLTPANAVKLHQTVRSLSEVARS